MTRKKMRLPHLLAFFFLSVIAVLVLAPIVLTFLYSFFPVKEMEAYLKTRGNYVDTKWMDIRLSPALVSLRQYYSLLIEKPVYLQLFFQSVKYTALILFGQALVIPALSYALACFKFKGRDGLFFLILALMLMPFQVTMAPSVLTMRTLGILNTTWAVVLPMVFSPFYVFLLRQYMVGIPHEMLEAGLMDGAGTIRAYLHLVLPVSRPIIGAACALSFADIWNMVEQPLIYLNNARHLQPLSVMFNIMSTEEMGVAFAGAALYIMPAMLIYVCFQEDILIGIQLSDMK